MSPFAFRTEGRSAWSSSVGTRVRVSSGASSRCRCHPRTRVYVDSGSTDGSVAFARSRGVIVVELAQDRPFTAARARNAGHRALLERWPRLRMVQFVDGDCEIAPGWLERATDVLMERDDVGVACGRRRETSSGRQRLSPPVRHGVGHRDRGDALVRRRCVDADPDVRRRGRIRRSADRRGGTGAVPAHPPGGLEGVADRCRHDLPRRRHAALLAVVASLRACRLRRRGGHRDVRVATIPADAP